MKLSSFLWAAVAVLSLESATAARAAERQVLFGHVPAAVANRQPVGRLAGSARLNLAIGLPLRNPEALSNLLQQIYDPASSNYRRYLTPAQFTEMFGPTKEDYQALISFAAANGFTVTATHPNRVVLDVAGAVTNIERVFQVTMRIYQHPREARTFHAPDVEPSLGLTVPVLNISGLEDYSLPRPNHRLKALAPTAVVLPNGGSGPGGSYRGNDFRAAYVPGTALTGTGQSVGLLQFDGFYATDIATYVSQAGLPTIPLVVVPIDGGVSKPGSGNSEVALDIEMAISMAPGLARVYVYEAPNPSPWVDLLSRMANDNLSRQLSCSWGGGSPDATAEQIFQQMAAQGQSFFNASGDSDAFTSAIPFPSDSPNITQVGGTTLTTTGPGGAYVSETAWNWGLVNGSYAGTSGGVSTFYTIPGYQQGINMSTNLGSTTMRNVPDVALTGDDVYVVYNNGSSGVFGGTSCAAPLWAGFMALVNQQASIGGSPSVGFVNPIVYNIGKTNANYATIFHDTTTGNNFSAQSPAKYPAAAAYDLCTGWGTPNGGNLINLLTPAVVKPLLINAGFTLSGETCPPINGAIDPGETVTVNLALQNLGTANTTNLVVTLVATNGVTSPGAPQNYGTIVAGGASVARSFSFTASGACGDTILPTFQLQNAASNLGTMTLSAPLGATVLLTVSKTNANTIKIPSSGNSGPASVFPSTISVSGVTDTVSKVTVTLRGMTHTSPDDMDVLLVGPAGQKLLLMSDAGGGGNINNVTLTFDDSAASALPDSGQITSGTWQPANYGSGDTFSSPAPGAPYEATLSIFNGQNPNGDWLLYVQDDRNPNSGSLAQGWSLAISTSHRVCCSGTAIAADLAIGQTASPALLNAGSNLTFNLSITNLGPNPAARAIVVDTLPAGISFVSAGTTQGTVSNSADTVSCDLGAMANRAVATVTINATATTAGTRTNFASVSSGPGDPNSANNTADAAFFVNSFPTITAITNRTINADTTGAIAFTIGDAETDASALSLSRTSSNTNLVPVANIVFGGSGNNRTATVTPVTNASGSTTIAINVNDGLASAASSFLLTVTPVNDPPVVAAIADRTIYELTTLVFTNVASDLQTNALTFSLGAGAPTNATISPAGGVFSWTPDESQGPSTNVISVIVTDDGVPSLSATQSFTVFVLETNSAPTLEGIRDRVVHAGALIQFTNTATDSDFPTNGLTFSLEIGAPAAAAVNLTNGIFSWQTSGADADTTNRITVVVTDDGAPGLGASRTFTATVLSQPLIQSITVSNSIVTLTWTAMGGQGYRLQTNASLDPLTWGDAGAELIAGGPTATATAAVDQATKYFRVRVLP